MIGVECGKDGKPRELHIYKAADVSNVGSKPQIAETSNWTIGEQNMISSEYFKTNKIIVNGTFTDSSNEETFYALNVVKGNRKH